jgi:uncharacterized protein YecT (DUF1311 family)
MRCQNVLLVTMLCLGGVAVANDTAEVAGWYLPTLKSQVELGVTPALAKCLATLDGGSTAGGRACLEAENRLQDKRMNQSYKKALQKLNPARQVVLRESQRAWLKFVGSQCELEVGPPTGGTDWVDELAICDLHWRAYRAKLLESLDE